MRQQIRTELTELDDRLDNENTPLPWVAGDLDLAMIRRRTRSALGAVVAVLDAHPVSEDGRCRSCRRRQICPADEVQRVYAAGWLMTGGLADRREGDPSAISTRQLS